MLQIKKGDILILSGEGEIGSFELYHGTPSKLAKRLYDECCHGDSWARGIECLDMDSEGYPFGIDLSTGEYSMLPKEI